MRLLHNQRIHVCHHMQGRCCIISLMADVMQIRTGQEVHSYDSQLLVTMA